MAAAVAALETVDAFLGGLVPALPPETLLVLASDHGNIEDITQGHTRNPTFSLLVGPGARELAQGASCITDIPDLILRCAGQARLIATPPLSGPSRLTPLSM